MKGGLNMCILNKLGNNKVEKGFLNIIPPNNTLFDTSNVKFEHLQPFQMRSNEIEQSYQMRATRNGPKAFRQG